MDSGRQLLTLYDKMPIEMRTLRNVPDYLGIRISGLLISSPNVINILADIQGKR